jgi:hypothetical protein
MGLIFNLHGFAGKTMIKRLEETNKKPARRPAF